MKNAQENAGPENLRNFPRLFLLAGEETIGVIGVGGAPGGHLDQQCALDALKNSQAELNAG